MTLHIRLYTSDGCPHCAAVKQILRKLLSTRYKTVVEERNISHDRDAKADLYMMNLLSTPVVECSGKILAGEEVFVGENLEALIEGEEEQ